MCTFCNRFKEDIEHLLFHCPLPLSFWRGFEAFWNINMNEILNLSVQHIIVGISNETSQLLNYCILVGKFTIFQFRKNNMKLSLELLKVKLIQRYSKARFKRRTLHVPNLMQRRKIYCFRSFALDSAHVKFDV